MGGIQFDLEPTVLIGLVNFTLLGVLVWVGVLILLHIRGLTLAMKAARRRRRRQTEQQHGAGTYHNTQSGTYEQAVQRSEDPEEATLRRMLDYKAEQQGNTPEEEDS
jgi:hypothetical protein